MFARLYLYTRALETSSLARFCFSVSGYGLILSAGLLLDQQLIRGGTRWRGLSFVGSQREANLGSKHSIGNVCLR